MTSSAEPGTGSPHGGTRVLIVGVGNPLLGDEGLGVHVARMLSAAKPDLPEGLDVIDAGTALFDVVPEMQHYQHVILVDAICIGGSPGSLYRTELDADLIGLPGATLPLSLHDSGVLQTLAQIRLLGLLPPRVTLLGAEPERMEPSLDLSPALRRAARRIVAALLAEVV